MNASGLLSPQQRKFWSDNGFLVLPGFAADRDVYAVKNLLSRIWEERPPTVVVDDLVTGVRARIADVDTGPDIHSFKVNDLYLEFDEVRRLALGDSIGAILAELLDDRPVLVNSLNFERGSQQPYHVDSLYMTPRTLGNLAATWIALEDCHVDAGPLSYYPQSNHIVPFQFRGGGYHFSPDEMSSWSDYVFSEVETRGLERELFAARTGDLFIWSANLLHGGSAIRDQRRTRHSLVSHFWTRADCEAAGLDLVPFEDSYWYTRPPQAVPPAMVGPGQPDRPRRRDDVARRLMARVRRSVR